MDDKTFIERIGGSTKLAKLLKFDLKNGVGRVNNWKTRGIPAAVKLAHPEIFLRPLRGKAKKRPAAK